MDEPSVADANADDHVVRATASATVAGDWSLVLAAAGINHRVVEGRGAFWLVVSGADVRAAVDALSAFDAESVPKVAPPAPDVGPSVLGVLVGASLLAMFAVTGPGDAPHPT